KEYKTSPIKKEDFYASSGFDQSFKGHEKVLATTTTSADGSFSFHFVHTETGLGKFQENVSWPTGGGEFSQSMKGNMYKVIRLKVENDYYCSPDMNIKVNPWEAIDLGTLVSYVKSYDLKVIIKSTKASFYEKISIGAGVPLDKVSTSVVRKTKIPGVPYNEGMKVSGGNSLKLPGSISTVVAEGETDKDGGILVRNLVSHNPDNNQDRYYIKCATPKTDGILNYKTKEVRYNPLSLEDKKEFPFNKLTYQTIKPKNGIAHNEYYGSTVVWNSEFEVNTFTKEIELYPELPRIYGQLYSMLTVNKPLAGEKVALLEIYADKPIKKILAVTDSNGRFEFNDLPVELDVNFDQSDKKFINQVKGPSRLISSKVTGYKLYLKDLGKLSYGIQSEENIPLEPDGRLAGYVVDEEGNSVMASVYVDSIRADTKIVYKYKSGNSGGKSKGGYMPAFDKVLSYFEMTVPSGKSRKIIIEPKDKGTYY